MGKAKVAILSSFATTKMLGYGDDWLDMCLPLHLTEWEEVDDSKLFEIREGLRILNETKEVKNHGMVYQLFVKENTEVLILKSLSMYEGHVRAEEQKRLKHAEKERERRSNDEVSRAWKKRSLALKNAIKALELTGGNAATLDGLRRELKEWEESKKKKKA